MAFVILFLTRGWLITSTSSPFFRFVDNHAPGASKLSEIRVSYTWRRGLRCSRYWNWTQLNSVFVPTVTCATCSFPLFDCDFPHRCLTAHLFHFPLFSLFFLSKKVNLDLENPPWSTACFSPICTQRELSLEQQVKHSIFLHFYVLFLSHIHINHSENSAFVCPLNREDREDGPDRGVDGRDRGARREAPPHCGWHARIRGRHQQPRLVWNLFFLGRALLFVDINHPVSGL